MIRPVSCVARMAGPLSVTALLISGCSNQIPETSMDLLRAGKPSICTAADVEDTVRRLIYPKGIEHEGYTIAFADASLESFDPVVSRATCNAALTIEGPNGAVVERTIIDFAVSPAAQDPTGFIVAGKFGPFTERLENAVAEVATARAEEEGARQAQEALVATVKPGWLIGRWVKASAGSDACVTGPFDEFARGGRLTINGNSGRWNLSGLDVNYVMPGNSGIFTITNASANEYSTEFADGNDGEFRRCTAEDMRPTVIESMDPLAGMDVDENEAIDPAS